jgi:RNA polymerase sigma-70 factor, ECF subfamily
METTLDLTVAEQDRDLDLVKLAKRGQREAFDELFQRHKDFIYNVCRRMLGCPEDAADATQAAFVQAYRSIGAFRGQSSFRSWTCRIAINTCNVFLRKEARRKALREHSPESESTDRQDGVVMDVVRELPPGVRSVLVLFYFEGLSGEELAAALGCSHRAARVRLHRARTAFREKYEEVLR